MYSACIHCAGNLGSNEALEAFPVGGRLAFDPKRGRLWVVCTHCERWNLSPLDERWEAIEQAERRFREARLRVSTDEIGMARLREGLDLIRIGDPQRPEMAAWRYGDQFGRRRNRNLLMSGAAVGAAAGLYATFVWVGVAVGAFAGVYANPAIWDTLIHGRPGKVVARVRDETGALMVIQRRHARMSAIERSDGPASFWLRVEHTEGTRLVHGDEAMRIAAQLLPTVNRFGASRQRVQDAVGLLEEEGDPGRVLARIGRMHGALRQDKRPTYPKSRKALTVQKLPGVLHHLPLRERLALEMALHEDSERRAMDGELHELARAWREAEEIAAIADDMFVPTALRDRIAELRERESVAPDAPDARDARHDARDVRDARTTDRSSDGE